MASAPHPLRQPFTQEENNLYSSIFKQLDVENLGIVTGETARSTFEKSGLPPTILGEIWQLADPTNLGFLNQFAFSVALRLIGHVQTGAKPDKSLIDVAGQLPRFQGISQPQQAVAHQQAQHQPLSPQFTSLPPLTNHDISKFAQLFNKSAAGGILSGEQAREIFVKAKLPTPVLGQIWGLVDTKNVGQLTRDEFIVAMFLIQGSLNGSIKTLPQLINQSLWDQVASFNSAGTSSTSSPQISNARPSPISRVPSSFGNASNDWVISPQKRAQFDTIFQGLDKNSQGVLGPAEVAPFLMTSKLPQDVLASIWDLADIHNTGEFTKEEFAIAMFLVQKKIAGAELPNVVPESLITSHQDAVNAQPAPVPTQAQVPQQVKSIPAIPSRDTKPSSSLSDLVDLNDAFTTPSPTIPDQRVTSGASVSSVKYTPTGSRFVPTSTFGQTIVEKAQPVSSPAPTPVSASVPAPVEKKPSNSYFNADQTAPLPNIQFPQPTGYGQPAAKSITSPLPPVQVKNVITPFGQNNDLLADSTSEVSGQLSKTTTDLANLSNQIGSLTNQTSQLHEKHTRAERELAKMTSLKNDIEAKLSKLRVAYDQEVQQTANVETLLATSRKETEQLRQEASVAEAQYNQVQTNLQNLQTELEESQKENSSLKERLGTLNAEQIELSRQLENTSNDVKQSKSLVAINSKQLDVAQIKSAGIREEIENLLSSVKELDTHHQTYLQKQADLGTLKEQIESNELGLAARHQQIKQADLDFQAKEAELSQRVEQQKQNELAIQQQEERIQQLNAKLQERYSNLQQRQVELNNAEAQLQQQQVEYAQRIQDFTYKQIQDATTGYTAAPAASNDEPVSKELSTEKSVVDSKPLEGTNTAATATAAAVGVAGVAAIATAAAVSSKSDDDDKYNTEFSSPLASTTEQGTSVTSDDYQYRTANQFQHLDIQRSDSASSSVQNNAPQSVRGDLDDQEVDDQVTSEEKPALAADVLSEDYNKKDVRQVAAPLSTSTTNLAHNDESSGAGSFEVVDEEKSESGSTLRPSTGVSDSKTVDAIEASIPGGWNVPAVSPSPLVAAADSLKEPEVKEVIPTGASADQFFSGQEPSSPVVLKQSNEEFPPIQDLQVDESDSEDEQFHETLDDLPDATQKQNHDDFSFESKPLDTDDFAGLEVAKEEKEVGDEFDGLEAAKDEVIGDDFDDLEQAPIDEFDNDEFTQQGDLDEHFDGSTFYGAEEHQQQSSSGQEWEDVFAGFGNQGQVPQHPQVAQPIPTTTQHSFTAEAPARPKIATTPRSLAVQELTGMGFSKEEALAALEKEKWNLEAATNYLLDSA